MGSSPREGLHPSWLLMQRIGHMGSQLWSLPKPTATPSPLTILIFNAFCSKPKHRDTAPFAPCLTGFHYQLLGAAPRVTALWVWLPCRVHIEEHTLILLFLILSHHLRFGAAVLLDGRALCLPRWKWSLLSKSREQLSLCRKKATARARIIPS